MKLTKTTLIGVLAAAVIPVAAQAEALRLGLITPPSHQWSKSAEAFAADVAEQTDGRIEVNVFPSGQLGSEAQMVQQLQRGSLDMAFLTAGEVANRNVNFSALFAPYLVANPEEGQALLRGETATGMLDELSSLGLVGLGYGMAGMRQIVMAGDVDSVADLEGRKIRTIPIEPELDFWRKLNAAPTPMPLPALYDAFVNGQVDGMQIDFEGTWNSRYVDHAGTILHSDHMLLPMVAVASMRNWQAMSAGDRDLLQTVVDEHLASIISAYSRLDGEYLEELRTTDVTIMEVDRDFFGDAVDAWYEEWRDRSPKLEALEQEADAL